MPDRSKSSPSTLSSSILIIHKTKNVQILTQNHIKVIPLEKIKDIIPGKTWNLQKWSFEGLVTSQKIIKHHFFIHLNCKHRWKKKFTFWPNFKDYCKFSRQLQAKIEILVNELGVLSLLQNITKHLFLLHFDHTQIANFDQKGSKGLDYNNIINIVNSIQQKWNGIVEPQPGETSPCMSNSPLIREKPQASCNVPFWPVIMPLKNKKTFFYLSHLWWFSVGIMFKSNIIKFITKLFIWLLSLSYF